MRRAFIVTGTLIVILAAIIGISNARDGDWGGTLICATSALLVTTTTAIVWQEEA